MTNKKRKRQPRPWWRKPKTIRRLAMAAMTMFIVVVGGLYLLQSGQGGGSDQFLVEPAPAFSLPTTGGGKFVSTEHLGKHNLLLYFNEGMG